MKPVMIAKKGYLKIKALQMCEMEPLYFLGLAYWIKEI